jgi:hypothetical protein
MVFVGYQQDAISLYAPVLSYYADVVIFIHRQREDDGSLGSTAEIIIGKQRNGPTGLINLHFMKDYARFELMDVFHGSPFPGGQA